MSFLKEVEQKEWALSCGVLLLLFALLNPFDWYMLSMGAMLALALFVAFFLAFLALLWRERHTGDERELAHQAWVGRVAYLCGSGVLVIALIVQSFQHEIDTFIVLTLGVMVFAKVLGSAYARTRF